ncbi:hypothetical protein CAPTEDRAFT_190024 [Capitella teleta]|uniref:Uncharacterized protein n=1 Tax=Capitella teleta TaxID=283909 RepID=R7UZS4_CAPTE|nr:hypothetical protein CAPTEDRAFT_190024 [Capitella teleta]|eukprot:ELU11789.1 hypothetical protein CAPTEDRAFT_190024 [Capitella teleta]
MKLKRNEYKHTKGRRCGIVDARVICPSNLYYAGLIQRKARNFYPSVANVYIARRSLLPAFFLVKVGCWRYENSSAVNLKSGSVVVDSANIADYSMGAVIFGGLFALKLEGNSGI